jgi:sulfate permease, SulP family
MKLPRTSAISFTPFLEEFSEYSLGYLRSDLWAALAVALMTIPQSIAYSLLAGLPPTAGIFSAIFGTIFASALGSSRYLISGPTTGTAILLQTSIAEIVSNYPVALVGAEKEALVLHILTQIVFVAGLIQIGASFLNVSKLLQFVSRPVVLGYFTGITVAIITTQLFYLTGVSTETAVSSTLQKIWIFLTLLLHIDFPTLFLGIGSLLTLLILRRMTKNLPDALLVLVGAALLANAVNLLHPSIALLSDYSLAATPAFTLTLPIFDLSLLNKIFPAAAAISFLAILEVFSISRTFATGKAPHVNQDVFSLGISNTILSFLYGSMPASGSVTRTALNYRLAAKTRFSAIFSGIFFAIAIFFFWPLVQKIPLAALAAILLATVPSLVHLKEIKLCFRATKEDAWVFCATVLSCLIFSLDVAFFIGILISIASFLLKSATPHLVEYAFNSKGRLMIVSPKDNEHRKVRIIGIAGELYFASADVIQGALRSIAEDRKTSAIVLRLNNVYHMDASMCLAILQLYQTLSSTDRHLVISGLTEEVWRVFHRAGLVKQIGPDNLYFTDESNPQFSTWKACLHAQELVHSKD